MEGSGFHSPGLQGLFCARGFCPGPEAFSQQWDLRWILRFGHETRPTAGQSAAAGSAFNLWAQACSNRVLLGSAEGCRAAGRLRGSGGLTHQSFCSWNQLVKTQTGLEKKTGRQPDSPWTPDCATAESLNWFFGASTGGDVTLPECMAPSAAPPVQARTATNTAELLQKCPSGPGTEAGRGLGARPTR